MPTKKLVIHAGTHKTGTTAIQNYLYEQSEHTGLSYLCGEEANSSLLMLQAFKEDLAKHPHFEHLRFSERLAAKLRGGARRQLARMAEGTQASDAVISAEEISSFTVDELHALQHFLTPFFDEIEVVLYVRPLKDCMKSTYQEVLKTRFRSLEETFPLNYMSIARKFDIAFGPGNVHFFEYCREKFPQGSIVTHFLEHLGRKAPDVQPSEDNLRLSREAVQLLYVYRLHYPYWSEEDPKRIIQLSGLIGSRFHFPSSLFDTLLSTGPHASQRFANRTGISIEENLQAHDDVGIRSEADLVNIPEHAAAWLQGQLRNGAQLRLSGSDTREQVAQAVRNLA